MSFYPFYFISHTSSANKIGAQRFLLRFEFCKLELIRLNKSINLMSFPNQMPRFMQRDVLQYGDPVLLLQFDLLPPVVKKHYCRIKISFLKVFEYFLQQ